MDIEGTLASGQVFLWRRAGPFWYGIDGGSVLKADDTGIVESSGAAADFFRYGDDAGIIRASLCQDPLLQRLVSRYEGLRITCQDFFQCAISFIVSANSNIPRIRKNLEAVCRRFGREREFDGIIFHTFPSPEVLASADVSEIRACGVGYRAPYIRGAASMVCDGFGRVAPGAAPYREAQDLMCSLPGVGRKVADCILLFACGYLEAFPLDRWLVRVLHERYHIGCGLPPRTGAEYAALHDAAVERLGPYAGYAQQYLFKMARDDSEKALKW